MWCQDSVVDRQPAGECVIFAASLCGQRLSTVVCDNLTVIITFNYDRDLSAAVCFT